MIETHTWPGPHNFLSLHWGILLRQVTWEQDHLLILSIMVSPILLAHMYPFLNIARIETMIFCLSLEAKFKASFAVVLSLKGCIVFIVVVSTYNGSPQLVARCRVVAQGQWLVASRCFLGDWWGADG